MRLLPGTLCLCLALALSYAVPSHHNRGEGDQQTEDQHEVYHNKEDHHIHGSHGDHGNRGDHHNHGDHGNRGDHHGHGDHGDHGDHHGHGNRHAVEHDRCKGIEFDAIMVNEEGIPYFFKGEDLWIGFHGDSDLANHTFKELDEYHHLGHVDAAFRMYFEDNPEDHKRIFFILDHHPGVVNMLLPEFKLTQMKESRICPESHEDQVFSYYQHNLEKGYPKKISEVFPGIPDHLDAAVECPKGDCKDDSVIFFKGDKVYHYDLKTKEVDEKEWDHLDNCTAALRFLDHFYCFHGTKFTKFHPVSGNVTGKYPKDARDYFMRCHKFGKDSDHTERETCSRVHLDALTSDDAGNVYAFRGHHYLEQKAGSDEWQSHPIDKNWKKLHSDVDAVFSYNNHLYMIKDNNVYVYSVGDTHTLLEGYPKTVTEELGITGHVDAAFVCADHHIVHIIQGQKMIDVDLAATPRVVKSEAPLHFKHVDGGTCGPEGVKILAGSYYYNYESPQVLVASRILPQPHKVSVELFGCDH